MDGRRFDELTRRMVDRRRIVSGGIGAMAAVISALAAGGRRAGAVCSPGGWYCQRDTDCCSGKCGSSSRTGRNRTCCSSASDATTCNGKCGTQTNNCGVVVQCGKCLGETCQAGSECGSGLCVDGVCCDRACDGECEQCSMSDSLGTCRPVTSSELNGNNECPASECSAQNEAVTYTCDGISSDCVASATPCAPFLCAAGVCASSCSADEQCSTNCVEETRTCCPATQWCDQLCCDGGSSGTEGCCGGGACCECFLDNGSSGGGSPYCCDDPARICGTYPNDQCMYEDQSCIDGSPVENVFICSDNDNCSQLCCGQTGGAGTGLCCDPSERCSGGACVAIGPECASDGDCSTGELCAEMTPGMGETGTCCAGILAFHPPNAPDGYHVCCSECVHAETQDSCQSGPDCGSTFRGGQPRA